MTLTISIRFLTGRAHLHPWQTHHSEGRVDWPPSPWRVLRAIVAVAGRGLTSLPFPDFVFPVPTSRPGKPAGRKQTAGSADLVDYWQDQAGDDIPVSRLTNLLAVLASAPTIWLPKTSGGHTRQYFPIHESGIVKNTGSSVFDTFAVVRKDQPLLFHWRDISAAEQQLIDLKLILSRMTYFGRAESWCRAEVHTDPPEATKGITTVGRDQTHWRCVCIEMGGKPEGREYDAYTMERRLASLPMTGDNTTDTLPKQAVQLLPKTKPIASDCRPKEEAEFHAVLQGERPEVSLLRCLLRESGQDIKDGLDRPIGTRWVHYAVPRMIYTLPRPTVQPKPRLEEAVDLVPYGLNTPTVHRAVLPPLTDTLLVADRFRSAVLAIYDEIHRGSRVPHPRSLSGREADDTVCRDHQHAFWWPTDEDNDGLLDHVTVYAPGGFPIREVDALRRLTRLRQRGGRPDLLVTPLFVGRAKDYGPWKEADNGQDQGTDWFVSATPYFCPLHLSHGRTGGSRVRPLTPVIREALQRQGLPHAPDEVEIQELVFDYEPDELQAVTAAIESGKLEQPVPPRQYFPVIDRPALFPPHSQALSRQLAAFPGVSLKAPDNGYPFGLAVGLFVNRGTRFIRALSFCRNRRGFRVKGFGRMLVMQFRIPRSRQPFAIGSQCHFGLGLFVPAVESHPE
jgi:CRISPR-associated protein Csb2